MSVRRLGHRQALLPPRGHVAADHLTAILRMPESISAYLDHAMFCDGRQYRYPPDTVHVTVVNLDRARVSVTDGIATLREQAALVAPRLRVDGLGCSPDTIFLRCIYDSEFAKLRRAVRSSFRLPLPSRPSDLLFRQLAFANVLRFNGPGESPPARIRPSATVELDRLQIVRTDRYLSHEGTTLLAEIRLRPASMF